LRQEEYPLDALALKFVTDMYFYLGNPVGIRDVVARGMAFCHARWS
jgi:hypothetical protein